MTEPGRARILILEADQAVADRLVQILENQDWEVVCHGVSKAALAALELSKDTPFDLFISNYKLPKMAGDEVLTAARRISPLTRRMLLLPSDQCDLLIRAINQAEIHACLVTPASDQDLVNHVKACLGAFKKIRKLEKLKRVTVHQNKQMFGIAQKLKKKDALNQGQISEKKAELLVLRSRLKKSGSTPLTLDQRITDLGISMTPAALQAEFTHLAGAARQILDRAAAQAGIAPVTTPFVPPPEDPEPGQDKSDVPEEITSLCTLVINTVMAVPGKKTDTDAVAGKAKREDAAATALEEMVEITLSEDQVRAHARFRGPITAPELIHLNGFLKLLADQNITFGILDDEALDHWLKSPDPDAGPICVAEGEAPVQGEDGSIAYQFETNYTNPGKLLADGRIDFRDRGSIPYVAKETLLAVKTPPKEGKNGMTVSGESIMVNEPFDPVFIAGNGTRLSEDGLSIFADLDGQPHLDHMGEVSVNPELPIDGDVDFETGNIDFKGNIIVSGTVKEGFTVKGVSLTAKEIEGAIIDITGDLQISDGITDADIVSSGNIYAKFINNSRVKAYGNLSIQKEIIDSEIMVSGACENTSGMILSSKISAKGGIQAGKIGTPSAKPARLKVGADDHVAERTAKLDEKLNASVAKLAEIRERIKAVEDQDQELYGQVTTKAQEQEEAQKRMTKLKAEIAALKQTNDQAGLAQALSQYKTADQELKRAEGELNAIFDVQDRYAKEIERFKEAIERIETNNKTLVLKKKGLRDFSESTPAVPAVEVHKHITQDTVVAGPNTSYTLREDQGRCKIVEQGTSEDGFHFYEIEILEL